MLFEIAEKAADICDQTWPVIVNSYTFCSLQCGASRVILLSRSLGLFRQHRLYCDYIDMEANDPQALQSLLLQLKQIVNSASSAQLWAKPPIIDSSYDENGDLIETQENDTPGLRQFKMSVSKEIEGIENVSQLLSPRLGTHSVVVPFVAYARRYCNVRNQRALLHRSVVGTPGRAQTCSGGREVLSSSPTQ